MRQDKPFAFSHKLITGPGGIYCNCCNKFGCTVRKMKTESRRIIRRAQKQNIQKLINE